MPKRLREIAADAGALREIDMPEALSAARAEIEGA